MQPSFLMPGIMVDSDHPAVLALAAAHAPAAAQASATARAVALYNAVRDGFRYDPYRGELSVQGMKASSVLSLGAGTTPGSAR